MCKCVQLLNVLKIDSQIMLIQDIKENNVLKEKKNCYINGMSPDVTAKFRKVTKKKKFNT